MTDKRDQMMAIRLTKSERAAIDDAAERCAMGSTTFARFILLNSIGLAPANVYVKKGKAKNRKLQKAASALTALAMCFAIGCGDAGAGEPRSGTGGEAGSAGSAGVGGSAGGAGSAGSAGIGGTGGDPWLETCYLDSDGDGFGDPDRPSARSSCAGSWVSNDLDCFDGNELAHPDSTIFGLDRGDGSFDYNCDELETMQDPAFADCPGQDGWWHLGVCIDPWDCNCIDEPAGCTFALPACGELGQWRQCGFPNRIDKFAACN